MLVVRAEPAGLEVRLHLRSGPVLHALLRDLLYRLLEPGKVILPLLDASEELREPLLRRLPIAEDLLDLAVRVRADLIVIGTHGRSGLRRALMGSVAEDVVRHAACPVLVVPQTVLQGKMKVPVAAGGETRA